MITTTSAWMAVLPWSKPWLKMTLSLMGQLNYSWAEHHVAYLRRNVSRYLLTRASVGVWKFPLHSLSEIFKCAWWLLWRPPDVALAGGHAEALPEGSEEGSLNWVWNMSMYGCIYFKEQRWAIRLRERDASLWFLQGYYARVSISLLMLLSQHYWTQWCSASASDIEIMSHMFALILLLMACI